MILGITPARGGSKGIPRKNIRLLAGKPLIAWTIEAAQRSKMLDDYVVSTEDAEIAEIAEAWGARVIWRPMDLAGDNVVTLPVLQHVVELVPADTVVLLQATSPIRDEGLIDRCIQRFFETQADALATGFICNYVEYGKNYSPRQAIEGFFYDDGNVYVKEADLIRRGQQHGERLERVHIDREQNVEIDDEFDFWLAEQILKHRQGLT
jgi:N-acylneuraminate cytidylyltransferase